MRLLFLLNLFTLLPVLAQEAAPKFELLFPPKCEWRATWTELPSTNKELETTQAMRLYKFHLLPERSHAKILNILWTRYEPLYRAQVQWSDGITTESWIYEKTSIIGTIPQGGGPQTFTTRPKPKTFYNHVNLFELWWVKEEQFKGEVLFQKTKCRHYNDSDGRQAWFSVETRKPVAMKNGNVQITYEFLPEPMSLVISSDVKALLEAQHIIQNPKAPDER